MDTITVKLTDGTVERYEACNFNIREDTRTVKVFPKAGYSIIYNLDCIQSIGWRTEDTELKECDSKLSDEEVERSIL